MLGLTTNVGFLRALVAGDEFRDATIDTAWLDGATVAEPDADTARVFAAWTQALVTTSSWDAPHPFQGDGWRLAADPAPGRRRARPAGGRGPRRRPRRGRPP